MGKSRAIGSQQSGGRQRQPHNRRRETKHLPLPQLRPHDTERRHLPHFRPADNRHRDIAEGKHQLAQRKQHSEMEQHAVHPARQKARHGRHLQQRGAAGSPPQRGKPRACAHRMGGKRRGQRLHRRSARPHDCRHTRRPFERLPATRHSHTREQKSRRAISHSPHPRRRKRTA